ncbi:MAG TPA: translocation/assembly module TamB domain-containing protein [Thiobacillaceae bacterium]|nr:translocation/assembly module TamB domain-containing protein [Thiobacillaceae bacterium]
MRKLAWGAGGAVAALVLLAGALVWLTTTERGFLRLASAAPSLSGGRVTLDGVQGHLGAPLSVRKLTILTARQRIDIEGLRIEWRPRALLQRRLEVDLLAAQTLRLVTLEKSAAPLAAPTSLRLPVEVQVHAFDLGRLELTGTDVNRPLQFERLRAALDGRGDLYRLIGASLSSPWGDLEGQLDLGKDAPFAITGKIEAARRDPVPVHAALRLEGTLSALVFDLAGDAQDMNFLARGEFAPFSKVRLPRLLVAGEGIDPRAFAADAPAADLAFSGVFEGEEGERLLGSFSLSNRTPGRLDEHRLPLAGLTGAAAGDLSGADFSALSIDLGPAGKLTGSGRWRDGRVTIELSGPSLDLSGLHRDLYATRMRTDLRFAGDAARQVLGAELEERWGKGKLMISHADRILRLESATFAGQMGRANATGMLRLDAGRAFSAEFDVAQLNPARFGAFPRGRLNVRGLVSGVLAPELRLQTQFTLPPGTLEDRPVTGHGRLRYERRHLAEADVDLDVAGNRARVKGAYGRAGDRLRWDVDAPALERLKLGLAGRLKSVGSAGGDLDAPQIQAQIAASGLHLRDVFAAEALDLQLDLAAEADGAFNGRLDARGVTLAGQSLHLVHAEAAGRRRAHTLSIDAQLPDWRVTAGFAGGFDERWTWRGELTRGEAQGRWPVLLTAPATLVLSGARQVVDGLAATVAGGRVVVEHFSREGLRMATRGSLSAMPVAPFLTLAPFEPSLATDLRLSGDWDLRADARLDGRLRLRRESGDVHLTDPELALGLTALSLDLEAESGVVGARLVATSRDAGQLRAEGRAPLERDGIGFTLPRTAPFTWSAQLEVPDLRLLRPLAPVGTRTDARVDARLVGSGSLAAPRIDGNLVADSIRFRMPDEGIAITDGILRLVLEGDRVRVQEGALKGRSGRVVIAGEAQLRNPEAGLTLTFEEFAATNRSDRRVVVSGVTQLALSRQRLRLEGDLRADRARLEMPEASRPRLSSDVVVVGEPPRDAREARRIPLDLDLRLDLGNDFLFKGGGLDARLGGQLRVQTPNDVMRAEGRIRVAKGQYSAYGQTLDIERGELSFIGPIDNPGLDVLAVRKTPTVKVGVQVRGTVQRPIVTLYSDPAMPDTEKLAWLVLGHGLESGGQQEFALLQLAAGALLSQAESVSVQSQLAEALHIDTFAVRSGEGEDLAAAVVSVGKRLSSRTILSYEQSLDGLNQVVKVLYQLSRRIRLEAQTGQRSSFDVFYTREYD